MKQIKVAMLILIIASTLCATFNITPLLRAETTEDYLTLHPWYLVDAVGTYFEVANSTYLNVTLTSSETVHIVLKSAPKMVTYYIYSNTSATSTVLTLGGFEVEKTYYRYVDGDFAESFTTSLEGQYTYLQDISDWHHIFIQEVSSTIYIRPDGSVDPTSAPIAVNGNVYTFTANIEETLVVQRDNVIIDGNGYSIRGPGIFPESYGLYLDRRTGVTIRNILVEEWDWTGILLAWCNNNEIRGNTFLGNGWIDLGFGLELWESLSNLVTANTFRNNHIGVGLGARGMSEDLCTYNTVSDNYISSSEMGITTFFADHNTITRNTVTASDDGFFIAFNSDYNVISDNTVFNNGYGFRMLAQLNVIYHNDIILNEIQAYIYGPGELNHWYHPDLLEGNYWSDYPGVDDGSGTGKHAVAGDGIGDTNIPWPEPGYDYYPLTTPRRPFVTADIDVDPDTLNLKSNGEFVTAYIELPEGYNVSDIVLETVYLEGIQAITDPTYGFVTDPGSYLMDHDGDGVLERMVKFDRATLRDALTDMIDYEEGIRFYDLTLTVTGQVAGMPFVGKDTIVVIRK